MKLDQFRVGGYEDESGEYTEPVQVNCKQCGEVGRFTFRNDGGADYTEDLLELVKWAQEHVCSEKWRDATEEEVANWPTRGQLQQHFADARLVKDYGVYYKYQVRER